MNLTHAEQPIRRHADGSIDIRHYARKAGAERRHAVAGCVALLAAALRTMFMAPQGGDGAPRHR